MSLQLVLVTDTNIWIDLINGGLLVETFRLPYQFITPDFAKAEFIRIPWQDLEQMGLNFSELRPDLVQELFNLRPQYGRLSVIDLSVFILARDLKAVLITGDQGLRQLANLYKLEVHGILWILDELIRTEIIEQSHACDCLERILDLGARLPIEECNRRLKQWRSNS